MRGAGVYDRMKFVVVEDQEAARTDLLNRLADAGFLGENRLGTPSTYLEAKTLLAERASEIDVVFLDLRLPRNEKDLREDKAHGGDLLGYIHEDLNRRAGVGIRVVIVSGENVIDGMQDKAYYGMYKGTLAGIVLKSEPEKTLKRSLKQLRRDPIRAALRRLSVDVLDEYDVLQDGEALVSERLKAARQIGLRLARNEVDHYLDQSGGSAEYADDLLGLIKSHIESRFEGRVRRSNISADVGWNSFLWRGAMIQHLYTLNNYRNVYEHLGEQPYRQHGENEDRWSISEEVLTLVERGDAIAKAAAAIMEEMLTWYLPWHEQIYLPWSTGGGR